MQKVNGAKNGTERERERERRLGSGRGKLTKWNNIMNIQGGIQLVCDSSTDFKNYQVSWIIQNFEKNTHTECGNYVEGATGSYPVYYSPERLQGIQKKK